MTTESPRKNILLTNRSLLIGCEAFLPLPVFGIYKSGITISMVAKIVLMRKAACIKKARSDTYLRPHLLDVF